MSESIASSPPHRPWFLVAGLMLAFLFGMGGWLEGCRTISFYREPLDVARIEREIPDSGDRERFDQALVRYVAALDAARPRAFPLGVASFVVGAALLAFALRAIAKQPSARSAIVQLLLLQAALVMLASLMTRDIRAAERVFGSEMRRITVRDGPPPRRLFTERALTIASLRSLVWAPSMGWAGLRGGICGLVILAMTRRRTREFFEASAVSERQG